MELAVKPFQPENTSSQPGGSTILDRLMTAVSESFASLRRAVTNDTLIKASLDNTRDWPVVHRLGHAATSWEVVDRDANAVVWQSTAPNDRPGSVILLRASASVNVTLRFC